MKRILILIAVFFIATTLLFTPATRGQNTTLDNTLVVCIGAHPDDLEIAISGSLYKNEIGKHPILWLIVTDGGADVDEYQYESNDSQNWLAKDGQIAITWEAPDGSNVTRQFYSEDLAKKRCGGYFEGLNWKEEAASHNSLFGVAYDLKTRVTNFVDAAIKKIQLSYLDPSNPAQLLMYPDGALENAESDFTSSITNSIATEINRIVESKGYQKSQLKMISHSPEEVSNNANEHPDHKVTGNAVRQAIDILHSNYGFGQIDAKWYTVYNPIDPKPGYLRVDEDISQQQLQKSDLAKACWETEIVHLRSINYSWDDYPTNPGQYEYSVAQSYYSLVPTPEPSSSTQPSSTPFPVSLDTIISFFKNIYHQYPNATIIGIVVLVAVITITIAARKKNR